MTAGKVTAPGEGEQAGPRAGSAQEPEPGTEVAERAGVSAPAESEAAHGEAVAHLEVGDPSAPDAGPDRRALYGPFTTRQLLRLDEALRVADDSTGLTFSVYVGDLEQPVRPHTEKLHSQLPDPARSVLIAVCPNQRVLEIVTGSVARRQLPDRDCKLAALSMTAAFSGGDLAGGLVTGVAQLAEHGRA